MMTNTALLTASALLVFAYLVDAFGRRFRLPSVVLLIVTGIVLRQLGDLFQLHLKWIDPVVPILGTLGLILIVLNGALDLSVTRERRRLIAASSASALLGFLVALGLFAALFHYTITLPWASAVLAAIPFAVISSAVAIPAATGLPGSAREFVVFESALSDIIGVLVFYAWLDANGSIAAFATDLLGYGAISLVMAAIAAIGLFYLIHRMQGQVRFLPLIAGLVLLYALGKAAHLSPLILVLGCGLLLNNPHLIERNAWLKRLHDDDYDRTLREFKGLTAELTFATKSFFFLLLGYWTELRHMTDLSAWAIAGVALAAIYLPRWSILRLLRQPDAERLLWIAPRGLITVLLFLLAKEAGALEKFPFGAVMLVVLATAALTALAQRDRVGAVEGVSEVSPARGPEPLPIRPRPAPTESQQLAWRRPAPPPSMDP